MMANKLELTWYGKDEPIRVEPRLLMKTVVNLKIAVYFSAMSLARCPR